MNKFTVYVNVSISNLLLSRLKEWERWQAGSVVYVTVLLLLTQGVGEVASRQCSVHDSTLIVDSRSGRGGKQAV